MILDICIIAIVYNIFGDVIVYNIWNNWKMNSRLIVKNIPKNISE